ncbi:hypothetical protein D3C87_1338730 [compost metagenome]
MNVSCWKKGWSPGRSAKISTMFSAIVYPISNRVLTRPVSRISERKYSLSMTVLIDCDESRMVPNNRFSPTVASLL